MARRREWRHSRPIRCAAVAAVIAGALMLSGGVSGNAQERIFEESFLAPPDLIQSILNRNNHYDTLDNLSPDGDHFVIPVDRYFSSFELMSQKTYRLAMLEFCPEVNREWRLSTYGTKGLKIYSLSGKNSVDVRVPDGILISDMTWSPDGKKLAFLAHLRRGSQAWVADAATGEAKALSEAYVMATLSGRPRRGRGGAAGSAMLQWTGDGSIVTLLVPSDRGPEPQAGPTPPAPIIRSTRDKATATRTYPFLMRTPHDKALFRYYTTSQPTLLSSGQAPRKLGEPAMYMDISLSPDGRYILAEKLAEPFSYIVDFEQFPRDLVMLDMSGKIVSTIRRIPLQEAMTREGARSPAADLPRDVAWRPDGKGLIFLWAEKKSEAEGEQESAAGERKDRLMSLAPPFDIQQARTLVTEDKQFSDVKMSLDGKYAFGVLSGRGSGTKNLRDVFAYDLSRATPVKYYLAKDIDPEDILKSPGQVMTRRTGNGIEYALLTSDGSTAYLQGPGHKKDFKPRPFIDRVGITGGSKERVFESSAEYFEQPLAALDPDLRRMIVSRESKSMFPDSYLRGEDGSMARMTSNQDPFPEVAQCERVDFEFTRRDGLKIQGRITLPVGYRRGTRVPAVFWTYPREYKSFKEYERAAIESRNQNAYKRLDYRNASEIWLTQGYAVVVPDIPIIGKGNQFNDNYIHHLVDSMYAAIRRLDELGYVDVDRLGHGGHSYGAFATANILSHSPFFKAGIAGDGAYNRSLTPMSFQSERRFLWEATGTYLEMSPFFQADHMDTPLLMYHGAEDNNTGTFLIQSERYIQALTGLGKTAVLYIYPFESHGPRCRETYMDMWARWLEWFDKYVKGSGTTSTSQR
ncbi:MAG: hypothetical protein FJW35_01925 [Acidobacteria bacterium]|nr:hypothetical protein [Acidobacteriota bacterium]